VTELVDRTDPVESRSKAWHQSTLERLLDGCSWQYFLQYVLGLEAEQKPSAAVGIAFHAALEAHEKARMTGDVFSVDDMLELASSEVASMLPGQPDLGDLARAAVKNWALAPMKDGGPSHREWLARFEPVAIEPYFNVPLVDGARPIAGWIDGVYRDTERNRLFLIDHKTAKQLSRWGHDGAEHRHQATLYSAALALSPDYETDELVEMVYLVARTSIGKSKSFEPARRVIVQPDMLDVAELGERIRKAEQVVDAEAFTRKPDWVLCSAEWCPFFQGCLVTGELAGTPDAVKQRLSQ